MSRREWGATILIVALVFVVAGGFVLSFHSEPSATGRLHTALVAIGVGLIAVGVTGGVAGVWMLVARRT
ncbi:MAG TPA: hypothetical protein VLK30_02905 [Candidatus Limnocylindrales bacterium]|nr:hypothetical protein [Candidatus Limnocylindrales bacterium]